MRLLCLFAFLIFPLPVPSHGQAFQSADPLRALSTADAARQWEAVGRLDSPVSFCSASLIAPGLVLTAAHCLFDANGDRLADSDLIFSASLRNGRAEAYRGVRRSFIPETYTRPLGEASYDYVAQDMALLELDRPVSAANVAPIPPGEGANSRDFVTVVSYGADRESYASIEEDCQVLARDRVVQILSCSVVSGSSGAPVIRMTPAGPEVVAIMSGATQWQGDRVAIAVIVEDLLPSLLEARRTGGAGVLSQTPGSARRLTVGNDGRDGIGARFVRP